MPLPDAIGLQGGIGVMHPEGTTDETLPIFLSIRCQLQSGEQAEYRFSLMPRKGSLQVSQEHCVIQQHDTVFAELIRDTEEYSFSGPEHFVNTRLDDEEWTRSHLLLQSFFYVDPITSFLKTLREIEVYTLDPEQIRGVQEGALSYRLLADGSNAAEIADLLRKSDHWSMFLEYLSKCVPSIVNVQVVKEGVRTWLRLKQEWEGGYRYIEGRQVSDGTWRMIGVLLALFQEPAATLIAIEEPERYIHPGALSAVLGAIRTASRQSQIIITTQSPELLNDKHIDPKSILVVEWRDGASHVSPLTEGARQVLETKLQTAGELMAAGALEGF